MRGYLILIGLLGGGKAGVAGIGVCPGVGGGGKLCGWCVDGVMLASCVWRLWLFWFCGDELMSCSCDGGVSSRSCCPLSGGSVGVVLSSLVCWLEACGVPIPWSGRL